MTLFESENTISTFCPVNLSIFIESFAFYDKDQREIVRTGSLVLVIKRSQTGVIYYYSTYPSVASRDRTSAEKEEKREHDNGRRQRRTAL